MTKFFVKWWADTSRMPDAPQEAVQRVMKRLEIAAFTRVLALVPFR
ncbi:MAG TPA: hypothetical protein VEG65_04830 [Candidatus Bathyarchaeia archaeon]|nr:hypothetical protein [Candidatus Bathyarchaeia archaeon]